MSSEIDDVTLVYACRQGDANAWEVLIGRYQRLIYAIPRRAGLADDLVADVFQRVCVALLEHIQTIERPERIGAWLATTARRESWRQSRRVRATVTIGDGEDDQVAQLPDPAFLPEEVLERMERQHQVRQALATLDERCRTLLRLLFYRDDPPAYGEIAAQIGVPAGSIGPTRARCLQKLRRGLEEFEQ
ncbi:MAG: sigma-70 family RNA polymerase sigma factor [Oscillochloris sp.]|nr:sigma-70 family RNA polymerase sigma factor [Oscillochloris sp.]